MTSRRDILCLSSVSLACIVATLVNGGIFFTFGVFFKPLAAEFDWSRGEVSAIWTTMLVAYIPSCIFMGRLADRYGPRWVMALAAILIGMGLSLSSLTQSLGFIMFNYALVGLSGAATFTVPAAIIQRWFVRKGGLMLGVVLAASGVGGLLFALLANHLIGLYGWRSTFLILGSLFGTLMLIAAAGILSFPERMKAHPYGWQDGVYPWHGVPDSSFSIRKASRTFPFLGLIGIFTLLLGPNLFLEAHLVPYATDRGVSPSLAAAALGLVAAFNSVGQIILGGIADRIGWLRGTAIACFICFAMGLWLIFTRNAAMLYAFVVVFGTFQGGTVALLMGLSARFFGTRALAEVIGYGAGAALLVGGVFSFLGGAIFDWTGSYFIALAVAAACFFAAGILALAVRPPRALKK